MMLSPRPSDEAALVRTSPHHDRNSSSSFDNLPVIVAVTELLLQQTSTGFSDPSDASTSTHVPGHKQAPHTAADRVGLLNLLAGLADRGMLQRDRQVLQVAVPVLRGWISGSVGLEQVGESWV